MDEAWEKLTTAEVTGKTSEPEKEKGKAQSQ